jgi:hypothetical protein
MAEISLIPVTRGAIGGEIFNLLPFVQAHGFSYVIKISMIWNF